MSKFTKKTAASDSGAACKTETGSAKKSMKNNGPDGDTRAGRLKDVSTDRGTFRFKSNSKHD